ncbi:type I restriction enzyme S subunit [Flavobacterium sp. PL11]|uniref:restriction endonuclease subunit S n=1 Tax=Flavobacterium sp. PL11 TaxID=3071717 RepID=UPI002DF7C885|nr:type I restriction enzyme S subunit [Flavobacterium sp. PL11]
MNTTQHKTNFKNSPLGLIPEDWEVKKIGKITKTTAGGTPSTHKLEYWNGNIKWMSSGDLNLKRIYDVEGRITDIGLKNSSTKIIPEKCILIGLAGQGKTRGTVAMNMVELCTNQSVAAILPSKEFYEDYLYYNLDFRYLELRQLSTGDGGRGGLNLNIINSISIALPLLPEQTAIANCLSTWDKAIATQTQIIAQKELRKKALMQQLLSGKKRLKGFSGEWKEVRLKDIFDRVVTKNVEVNTNVVTISAQRGFIKQGDYFNKIVASDVLDNYFLVKKGDFCYNKSYSNGYPWGATKRLKDFEKAVVTTLYICFRLKDVAADSGEFFEHFFEENSLDKGLTKIAHEGGRAHGLLNVTPSDFFGLKLDVPEYEEQTAIANILQCADQEIQLLKNKLQQLKDQKKGLMQVLLTGKKRLKH